MHENTRAALQKIGMGILLPIFFLMAALLMGQSGADSETQGEQPGGTLAGANGRTLTLLSEHGRETMDIDTYLVGVLLGEMPADFQTEALRAQAIAARTYTLRKMTVGQKHGKNTVCTDETCCQAYTAPQAYLQSGGNETTIARMTYAVQDTADKVLFYDGELIEATYFSCAGDATEDAVAVWGQDYPYLQSVPSPWERDAAEYDDIRIFSAEEFQSALGLRLEGAVEQWFGQPSYTDGGGVDVLPVCGIPYRGTTLRILLGLRSTAFTVSVENGQICIRTKGYGHRVGLSQYGANALAQAGKSYEEILTYYYTDVQIVQYDYE